VTDLPLPPKISWPNTDTPLQAASQGASSLLFSSCGPEPGAPCTLAAQKPAARLLCTPTRLGALEVSIRPGRIVDQRISRLIMINPPINHGARPEHAD
jgi:hypothetical protein